MNDKDSVTETIRPTRSELVETLNILSDPDTMAAIGESIGLAAVPDRFAIAARLDQIAATMRSLIEAVEFTRLWISPVAPSTPDGES